MKAFFKGLKEKISGVLKLPAFKGRDGRKKKLPIRPIIIFAVIAAAGFFGYKKYSADNHSGKADETSRTSRVTRGTLSSKLTSTGTISPKDTYSITALVEGDVISADFEEGDQVEKDQVLYRIDVSSMESELKSAQNSLERSNTSYDDALKDYEEALADYSGNTYKSTRSGFIKELLVDAGDKVQGNTELAKLYDDTTMKIKAPFLSGEAACISPGQEVLLVLDDTEEELTGTVTAVSNMDEVLSGGRIVRYVTATVQNPGGLTEDHTAIMQTGGFICCEQGSFEAVTDLTLKAELSSSVEVKQVLVNEGDYVTSGTPIFLMDDEDAADLIRSYKDQVDSAEEKVESAKTKLDSTQDSYDNYTVTAPISGQVITKNVKKGDTLGKTSSGGTTTMAVIYDLSEVTFEMSIDELDIRNVKVGQKVDVTADALEGVAMTGTVTNISLESSQSNGVTNYPVTVTMDEVGDLLPGMNVDGEIILDEAEDTLMIPVDSLMRGNKVYVRDDTVTEADGNVPAGFRAVVVETGLTNDDYIEIVSGLSEGDEVYVSESTSQNNIFQMGGGQMGGGAPPDGGGHGGDMGGHGDMH